MNPSISIICPIRNMEGKLQNLRTWLNQCDSHFQVILVCDTCTDKTVEEIREIQGFSPSIQIEIIEGDFGTPGGARNAGLRRAENEWIVFWDSDDIGKPRDLLNGLKRNAANLVDAVVFGYEIYSHSTMKRPWLDWPSNHKKKIEYLALNPGIWRMCFRRSSINNIYFPEIRMAEDQLFINDFMGSAPKIEFCNDVVYKYFINVSTQLTSNKDAIKDLEIATSLLASYLGKNLNSKRFAVRIYGKILLTQIKKCQKQVKLKAGIELMSLLIRFPKLIFKLFLDIIVREPK